MLEVDPNAVLESLGPARRFADPSGPAKARLMAAGGALPLPPPQMASVLFALTLDPEDEIAQKAAASLSKLPDNVVLLKEIYLQRGRDKGVSLGSPVPRRPAPRNRCSSRPAIPT